MPWHYRGAIVAVVAFSILALSEAIEAPVLPSLFPSKTPDFFVIRSGSVIALRGESPYEPTRVQAMVAEQFPTDAEMIANSAYFLPPATIPIYAPFAAMSYPAAKAAWAIVSIIAAIAALLVLRILGSRWPTEPIEQLLPIVLLLNYITLVIVELGQTTLVCVGCVVAGQWCFERGRSIAFRSRSWPLFYDLLGAFLWAIPFIKPHVAFPLLPLAWYLGGWKRPVAIVAFVAALNATGCAMIGRSPLFLWDYVQYLGATHKRVSFNRAEINPVITSWNRLLYTLGGPLLELNAFTTLAAYLVWFALLACRIALSSTLPSRAWMAAAMAVGAVFCSQVLLYESFLLMLAIPWLRMLFASGYRLRGWFAVACMCLEQIPARAMTDRGILFHHALGIALLAIVVLTGPISESEEKKGL